MPHLIPVGYPGPTAPSQLKVYDWLKDIPTTKVHNTNKDQSPPVAHKQLKGEWAPIVCRKVQDPEQTVVVTGESGERTGVSVVVSNQPLVVPQKLHSGPEKSVVTPETYSQSILSQPLPKFTYTQEPYPQRIPPQSALKSTVTLESYAQSAFPESLSTSTLTPETSPQSDSPQPVPVSTHRSGPYYQKISSQSLSTSNLTQEAHLQTVPQESLPEAPGRIITHGRIAITGSTGIIP